jgi:hypothetical protein
LRKQKGGYIAYISPPISLVFPIFFYCVEKEKEDGLGMGFAERGRGRGT